MDDWQHGFYRLSVQERQALLAEQLNLSAREVAQLAEHTSFNGAQMIENYLTDYRLPEGVGLNLSVNGKKYVVPMVTEEPSVVAAASHAAKLLGDIQAPTTQRLMVGQVIFTERIEEQRIFDLTAQILMVANAAYPSMQHRGAGAKSLRVRTLPNFTSLDILVDVSEAMGANVVNTMAEAVGHFLSNRGLPVLTGILSNFATETLQSAMVRLTIGHQIKAQLADKIALLSQVAQEDPYRAATHNKGIMNGIDAALLATGNDWRAIESGAHAFAARDGQYRGLTTWQIKDQDLIGRIELPMPVGVIGGSMGIVPMVQLNRSILKVDSAAELAQVVTSVGLAQNFAALRALATEGIQAGHMRMQYRSLALEVGAKSTEINRLVARLQELPQVNRAIARQELQKLRGK